MSSSMRTSSTTRTHSTTSTRSLTHLFSATRTNTRTASLTSSRSVTRTGTATQSAMLPFVSTSFGDHMILQRAPQSAIVWGFASAGTVVKTTFRGKAYSVTAGGVDGVWRQALPPTPAGGPYTALSFSSSRGAVASLADVLFGDVFICSGQSNMVFSIDRILHAAAEANKANKYPDIRLFSVGQGMRSRAPLANLVSVQERWSVASKNTVNYFSAVCWLFGRNVHDGLGGLVPIGLISACWGGSPIEQWAPPPAFLSCNMSLGQSTLWNAMIHPFTVGPMALTGLTWYQGEADTHSQESIIQYECLFPSMISSWRAAFANPTAFFGFVQLSTWCNSPNYAIPAMRLVQLAAVALPKFGYGVAADHGAGCNIHPSAKQYCSTRLASSALALVYGHGIPWKSPSYASASASKIGRVVTVAIKDIPAGGLALRASSNAGTIDCSMNAGQCGWASITFNNGVTQNATVSISGNGRSIILKATGTSSAGATMAVATSYAWANVPFMTAYAAAYDLPVLAWNRAL